MRIVRDVGLAEDLAQDALVAALEQWPQIGRPGPPGRLADGHRQAPGDRPHPAGHNFRRKAEELGRELEVRQDLAEDDLDAALATRTTSATTSCA